MRERRDQPVFSPDSSNSLPIHVKERTVGDLEDVMKLLGQVINIDALDIRNRISHQDRSDCAHLNFKVVASGLHSHLLDFAAAMS
jgi:hypothetical protein